jgi:S1-C subfamily serine protease
MRINGYASWKRCSIMLCAVILFCVLYPVGAVSENLTVSERARDVFESSKHAVVSIQLVLKTRYLFGGDTQEQESNLELSGTVISPDGLTVVALSSTDPTGLIRTLSGELDDGDVATETSDVKIMLQDASEIEAQVVLRDNELDLAFIMPTERPDEPLPYVSIENPGKPEIFDQVVAINRLGQVANRVYSGALETIEAVVERPRTYYIPGSNPTHTSMGCPAFTLDGEFVGIFVVRAIRRTGTARSSSSNMIAIIVPADEIVYVAEQVPGFDDPE